jgi:hypothetical protein
VNGKFLDMEVVSARLNARENLAWGCRKAARMAFEGSENSGQKFDDRDVGGNIITGSLTAGCEFQKAR